MVKKTFELDGRLNLPKKVSFVNRPEGILCIEKFNPSFILVDNDEFEILKELLKGLSIKEASLIGYSKRKNVPLVEEKTKNLLKKIEKYNFYEGLNKPQDSKWPMHLYLTNKCNLKCKTCYKDAGLKKDDELTTKEIFSLVDSFSKQGPTNIVLSGGEPMLKKDFFKILEYIKPYGHKINVVTNGLLIKSRTTAERLTKLVDFLQISLDGATEHYNDFYRGRGTYKKILETIDMFSDLDFTLNIGMIVSEYNFKDIKQNIGNLFNSLKNKNLKLNVSNLLDKGRGKYCKSKGDHNLINEIINAVKDLNIKPKQWNVPTIRTYDCGFARSVTVDSNGEVYFCPVTNEFTKSNLNIRTSNFDFILQSFKEMNKSISVENMENCLDCDLEYLCGGGCRLDNLEKRNSYLNPEDCNKNRRELLYQELVNLRLD